MNDPRCGSIVSLSIYFLPKVPNFISLGMVNVKGYGQGPPPRETRGTCGHGIGGSCLGNLVSCQIHKCSLGVGKRQKFSFLFFSFPFKPRNALASHMKNTQGSHGCRKGTRAHIPHLRGVASPKAQPPLQTKHLGDAHLVGVLPSRFCTYLCGLVAALGGNKGQGNQTQERGMRMGV